MAMLIFAFASFSIVQQNYVSAYEVKHRKLNSFERPFKMKKNDVFFSVISSLVLEIFKLKENK